MDVPSYTKHIFKNKSSKYLVIIPVINEGIRIRNQLSKMSDLGISSSFDVVIADGGSTDNSLDLEFLSGMNIRGLLTKTGPGKLSAQMRMAMAFAVEENYDGVIFIDGNNKDNPEAIRSFAKHLDLGYDHIQGSRFIKGGVHENTPLSRYLAIILIHAPAISIASHFRYTDTTNGFRAYSRKFLIDDRVNPFRDIFSQYELHYYLAIRAPRLHFKTVEIPVERKYPSNGKTPTKIKGIRGNFIVLRTLFKACIGKFNPQVK